MLSNCVLLVATAILFEIGTVANAHQTSEGWTYPLACCKGTEIDGDCQRIPDGRVNEGRGGYIIRLMPGDHPQVTRNHIFLVPYGDAIPSGDNDFHMCLHPTEDNLNCFFAPPSGI